MLNVTTPIEVAGLHSPNREPLLSVVIPCYNETDRIQSIIEHWHQFLLKEIQHFEIVVINDGSTDGTGRILDRLRRNLKELRVIHQLNFGHGKAVRRGYEAARGNYVLQLDGNGRYSTEDFTRMWEIRSQAPLILGHRKHRLDSILRQGFSFMLRTLVKLFFDIELQDPNVPFRLFHRASLAPHLRALAPGLESVNVALAIQVKRERYDAIVEMPVPYRLPSKGTPNLSVRRLFNLGSKMFWELIQIRFSLGPNRTSPQATPFPKPSLAR